MLACRPTGSNAVDRYALQANMSASFARQKLLDKVDKLQSTKNWGSVAAPDGTVNVDALLGS